MAIYEANDENKYLNEQLEQMRRQTSSYLDEITHLKDISEQDHLKRPHHDERAEQREEVEILKRELMEIKANKERECNEMILRVEEVMGSVDKYKDMVQEMETDNTALQK